MVNVYKGKGNALECSSYRRMKLLEHVLKVLERVFEAQIRKIVKIDEMPFGFSPGKGTTDAIFIVRYVKSKKNSLANRRSCGWLLKTWRRLSIGYRVRYYGGSEICWSGGVDSKCG